MKYSAILCAVALSLTASISSHAADKPKLNLCTGGQDGLYWPMGNSIHDSLARTLTVNNIETGGTEDNYRKIEDGTCDGFIGQNDARNYMEAKNPDLVSRIEYMTYLTRDYVHLICNRNSGINKIKDFYGSDKRLVIGAPGSGSFITWDMFGKLESRYTKIKTEHVDFDTGLTRIAQNDAACMLWIAGLNSNKMKRINARGKGLLQLVPLNDGDLDNAKDSKGLPIYTFGKIPGGTYYELQYGTFSTAVKTVYQNNVLAVTKKWASENRKAYSELSDVGMRIYQQNNND